MRYVLRLVPFGVVVVSVLAIAPPVHARQFSCAAGDVQCLALAIADANAQPGHHRIGLQPGVYTLTAVDHDSSGPTGLPSIMGTMRIESSGPGMARLVRDASAPDFRLLHVAPGGELELEGIALENGRLGSLVSQRHGGALLNEGGAVRILRGELLRNTAIYGGAVSNQCGELQIVETTISDSVARSAGGGLYTCGRSVVVDSLISSNEAQFGPGGGIYSTEGSLHLSRTIVGNNGAETCGGLYLVSGTALIERSTFDHNVGEGAAAVVVSDRAQLTVRDSAFLRNGVGLPGFGVLTNFGHAEIVNSTFALNRLSRSLGGTTVISNGGTLSITGSTLADNSVTDPTGAYRQVTTATAALTTLQNTILANDDNPFVTACEGPTTSLGTNLIGDPAGCAIALQASDLIGAAGLDLLADDGTAGNGHLPLLPTSAAIGAANDDACSKKDQLGVPRKKSCDIGAVEFNPHAK